MNLVPFQMLQELTDRKQSAEIIAWLQENGWTFTVGWSGRPKVDYKEYCRHMIGGTEEREEHLSPDLSWFDGSKTKAS